MMSCGMCIYVSSDFRRDFGHQDFPERPQNLYLNDRGWPELSNAVLDVSRDPLQPPVGRPDCSIELQIRAVGRRLICPRRWNASRPSPNLL